MAEFSVSVPEPDIEDLRRRLRDTRWPDALPDSGWGYGADVTFVHDLCGYWAEGYDWTGFAARCNAYPQYRTTIDGQRLHFVHAQSAAANPAPLLLLHGWPGSYLEFRKIIPTLTGTGADVGFNVVVPSLPGYGFSGPTADSGWDARRVAGACAQLMERLGYERYFVHGTDWGTLIGMWLADRFPDKVAALHINLLRAPAPEQDPMAGLSAQELATLDAASAFARFETGYQAIQSTKPQSLAFGLTDSPAGLAAWITEKYVTWTDCGGDPAAWTFSQDDLLDTISVYWLTKTIASSMRLYYETLRPGRLRMPSPPKVPLGHSAFPAEIMAVPRRWAELAYPTLEYWNAVPHGGHFPAIEQPVLAAKELLAFFGGRTL